MASDRRIVIDRLAEKDHIEETRPCGEGVWFEKFESGNNIHAFTRLMEDCRWYLAHYNESARTGILMPVPEPDDDPEPVTDGGLPPLTYGDCDCGGVHCLDRSTVDGPAVQFPCDNPDCDWVKTIARSVLEDELAEADADVTLDDYAEDGEQGVPA